MSGFTSGTPYCLITDNKDASGVAVDGPCVFHGIWFAVDGSNDIVVNVYDNTAASGKRLIPINTNDNGFKVLGNAISYSITMPKPVYVENGIYVSITGNNYGYQVLYEQ